LTAPRDFLRWNFLREEAADLNFPLGHPSPERRTALGDRSEVQMQPAA
jgi:hypothetical protein